VFGEDIWVEKKGKGTENKVGIGILCCLGVFLRKERICEECHVPP
jgi:hypothetical protein